MDGRTGIYRAPPWPHLLSGRREGGYAIYGPVCLQIFFTIEEHGNSVRFNTTKGSIEH